MVVASGLEVNVLGVTTTREEIVTLDTPIGRYWAVCSVVEATDHNGDLIETKRSTEIQTPVRRAHRIHLDSTFLPAIIKAVEDDLAKKEGK